MAVARAAAQHAAQRLLGLLDARRGVGAQQLRRSDEHPRRADAALRRAGRVEARDQRPALVRERDPLHRLDARAVALAERGEAGADLRAVEQHGAGAAIAGVAADLGAGEAEALAQRRGKPRLRRQGEPPLLAVDGELREDGLHRRVHAASARCASSRAASRR